MNDKTIHRHLADIAPGVQIPLDPEIATETWTALDNIRREIVVLLDQIGDPTMPKENAGKALMEGLVRVAVRTDDLINVAGDNCYRYVNGALLAVAPFTPSEVFNNHDQMAKVWEKGSQS